MDYFLNFEWVHEKVGRQFETRGFMIRKREKIETNRCLGCARGVNQEGLAAAAQRRWPIGPHQSFEFFYHLIREYQSQFKI